MEFLRFGSSIPGSYWGCCAVCIIQNFKVDPDAKASIELVDGDGGQAITGSKGKTLFAGPTYKDIFLQRLRIGTFSSRDMPNHGFLAVLTKGQIANANSVGHKWLKILKEQGFEFIRTVDNSVYTGTSLITENSSMSSHPNYVFGLFRNVGAGAISDPYTPPKEWTDLDSVVPEAWERLSDTKELSEKSQERQLELYKQLPNQKFLTKDELKEMNVPITLAGRRSTNPQQLESHRTPSKPVKAAPFAAKL